MVDATHGRLMAQIPVAFHELLTRKARYKGYHGGRGSGKSWAVADASLIRGIEEPIRVGCYREIQKSLATSMKQLLDDRISTLGLRDFYESTSHSIKGRNGTLYLFGGLRTNPESVKSTEGLDVAIIEEADVVSANSWKLLRPTVRQPHAEIWPIWNRKSVEDPIDALLLGERPPPRSIVRKVGWKDNPWYPITLHEERLYMLETDPVMYEHVYGGEPVAREDALVFRNWEVADLDDEIPPDARERFGADWGFSKDPTVLVKGRRFKNILYISHEAYRRKCDVVDTPALFAGSDHRDPPRWENRHGFPGVPGVHNSIIIADSARPEIISHMQRVGFNIRGAVKGARSVEDGVEYIRGLKVVIHPRCIHTIDEFKVYSYEIDEHTDEVLPKLADRDNHVIDAVRYMLEAERRSGRRSPAGVGPEGLGPKLIEG